MTRKYRLFRYGLLHAFDHRGPDRCCSRPLQTSPIVTRPVPRGLQNRGRTTRGVVTGRYCTRRIVLASDQCFSSP
jgi:hypothetical protein